MNYIQLTAKKSLTQEQLDNENTETFERLQDERLRHSTGSYGKYFEPIVRHLLLANGLIEGDFHARKNGSNSHVLEDGVIFINGKRLRYEVKSGNGIIGMIEPMENPIFSEEDIFPNIDIIFYSACVNEMENENDVKRWTIVLTREEFLDFIATEGPKRKQNVKTAVKFGTDEPYYRRINANTGSKIRDCIVLQSPYGEARARACKGKHYKKLADFLQEVGR